MYYDFRANGPLMLDATKMCNNNLCLLALFNICSLNLPGVSSVAWLWHGEPHGVPAAISSSLFSFSTVLFNAIFLLSLNYKHGNGFLVTMVSFHCSVWAPKVAANSVGPLGASSEL